MYEWKDSFDKTNIYPTLGANIGYWKMEIDKVDKDATKCASSQAYTCLSVCQSEFAFCSERFNVPWKWFCVFKRLLDLDYLNNKVVISKTPQTQIEQVRNLILHRAIKTLKFKNSNFSRTLLAHWVL